jgi:hypothetical protein
VGDAETMDRWKHHLRTCRRRHGVSTVAAATEDGVSPSTWRRRTDGEGWAAPYPGVRIAPWAPVGLAPALTAVVEAHGPGAAVTGTAAAWWLGVHPEPGTGDLEVVIPHGKRVRCVTDVTSEDPEQRRWLARCRRVRVRRCRWLRPDDVETVRGLRLTNAEAVAVHLGAGRPSTLRAFLVDARHRGLLDLDRLRHRLEEVGPTRGRHVVRFHVEDLLGSGPESVFHDRVLRDLAALGYRPTSHPVRIETAGGRTVLPDVPLEAWKVAVELDGDAFHRDREQRRRDRDRLAAYVATEWRPVVVDWRSWHEDREAILTTLDAAIARQRERGIGDNVRPPRTL